MVQINKMFVLLRAEGSAFIVVCAARYKWSGECTKAGVYIERARTCCKHGWAVASLWLSLDLGDRHPSYWQKTVKKSLQLISQILRKIIQKTLNINQNYQSIQLLKKNYIKNLNCDRKIAKIHVWFKEKHMKNLKYCQNCDRLNIEMSVCTEQMHEIHPYGAYVLLGSLDSVSLGGVMCS